MINFFKKSDNCSPRNRVMCFSEPKSRRKAAFTLYGGLFSTLPGGSNPGFLVSEPRQPFAWLVSVDPCLKSFSSSGLPVIGVIHSSQMQ